MKNKIEELTRNNDNNDYSVDNYSNKGIQLTEAKLTYYQEQDSCYDNGNPQYITIEKIDAGAGFYYVINTERWAFDDIDELVELIKRSDVR